MFFKSIFIWIYFWPITNSLSPTLFQIRITPWPTTRPAIRPSWLNRHQSPSPRQIWPNCKPLVCPISHLPSQPLPWPLPITAHVPSPCVGRTPTSLLSLLHLHTLNPHNCHHPMNHSRPSQPYHGLPFDLPSKPKITPKKTLTRQACPSTKRL